MSSKKYGTNEEFSLQIRIIKALVPPNLIADYYTTFRSRLIDINIIIIPIGLKKIMRILPNYIAMSFGLHTIARKEITRKQQTTWSCGTAD